MLFYMYILWFLFAFLIWCTVFVLHFAWMVCGMWKQNFLNGRPKLWVYNTTSCAQSTTRCKRCVAHFYFDQNDIHFLDNHTIVRCSCDLLKSRWSSSLEESTKECEKSCLHLLWHFIAPWCVQKIVINKKIMYTKFFF